MRYKNIELERKVRIRQFKRLLKESYELFGYFFLALVISFLLFWLWVIWWSI